MDDRIEKLIEFQVKSNISEETMCNDIGIARKTYYNLRKETTRPHESTMEQVNKFIDKNSIDVV